MLKNSLRTVFLMTLVFALMMAVGQIIGGANGLVIAFVIAMGMNAVSFWYSDKMVLKMYRAQPVDQQSHPKLYSMVRELSEKAGIPVPSVYIIPQQQPNAFATGRNPENAAVAFTQGILNMLDEDELRGVTAHEIGHIVHRDILTQTIVTTVVSALSMIAQFAIFIPLGGNDRNGNPLVALLALILAPIAATMLQAAISRTREYEADRYGGELSGSPKGLASALQKISTAAEQIPMQVSESARKSTAHMFPVNPFKGKGLMSLFATHPDTEERIQNLVKMAETGSYPS